MLVMSNLRPKISYILALAWDTAMKQSLADSPMAKVYSYANRFSGSPTMDVFVCSTGKTKVGVTLLYFDLRSRYKRHSMQLVKSYLLIPEHVDIVLLIAAESATKIWSHYLCGLYAWSGQQMDFSASTIPHQLGPLPTTSDAIRQFNAFL